MMSQDSEPRKPHEDVELIWKDVTVVFEDPRLLDTYYSTWIPQDDLDLQELKQNIESIPGIGKVDYFDDHRNMIPCWLDKPPEFVMNQCDDGYMNDESMESHICAFMDMCGIPYTGSGVESFVLVKDKSIVRGAAISVGVPVPTELYIGENEDIVSVVNKADKDNNISYPVFCKLANASGSTGVLDTCVAYDKDQAISGLMRLKDLHPKRPLLLQEYLCGREISIGMVGNIELGDFEIFHPVEVDYAGLNPKYPKIQLEEFKRDGDSEFWHQVKEVKADLTSKQLNDINEWVSKMYKRMKINDYARMDFRMDSHGNFKLMDVNPNCWLGGKFRMMAEWAGYKNWSDILRRVLVTSQMRHKLKKDQQLIKQKEQQSNKDSILDFIDKQNTIFTERRNNLQQQHQEKQQLL